MTCPAGAAGVVPEPSELSATHRFLCSCRERLSEVLLWFVKAEEMHRRKEIITVLSPKPRAWQIQSQA